MLRLLLAIALVLPALAPVLAAGPAILPAPGGDGGRAYEAAVRGSGIAVDVTYYDPAGPAPALSTDVEVDGPPDPAPARDDGSARWDLGPWAVGGLFAAVLALVLALAARYGGVRVASFARPPERGARDRPRRRAPGGSVPIEDPGPGSLEEIARIADRQRALHVLLERCLAHAAAANGQRVGRSQTARDVMRALPRNWPLLEPLRLVVAQAEVVQFGGRGLTEDMFGACVAAARPIFGAAAAAAGSR